MNNKIRKITPLGVVSTVAGSGYNGSNDDNGSVASFYHPTGIAVDENGNIFVTDTLNNEIRKITSFGEVTTFAGAVSEDSSDGTWCDC